MIPNERLPPRNLHKVQVDKTQALLKWQPPYDSPSSPLVRIWLYLCPLVCRRKKKQCCLIESGIIAGCVDCVQTYVVHLRDTVRKTERDYKVTTQNNTVEYSLKGLEPGGRYSVTVRLRNMTKEASYTLNTGTLHTTNPQNLTCYLFSQSSHSKQL